jgi:hypothetical protein
MPFVYKLEIAGHYYIGSSQQSYDERMRQHRVDYEKGLERKLFKFIRENGGWETVVSSVLLECDIYDRKELRKLEQTYIKKDDPLCLNTLNAYVDTAMVVREYYKAHRDAILVYKQSWGAARIICECGTEIRRGSKSGHEKTKIHQERLKTSKIFAESGAAE